MQIQAFQNTVSNAYNKTHKFLEMFEFTTRQGHFYMVVHFSTGLLKNAPLFRPMSFVTLCKVTGL